MLMKKLQPITQVVGAITIVLLAVYGLVAILGGDLVAWASGAVAPASAASAAEVGQASLSGLPNVINYQGMLRQADGSVVNGTYSMTFKLYHAPTGGAPVHTETLPQVVVRDGLFTALLGDAKKLPTGIFSQPLYISVQVGGDVEMQPRERIAPVPYAVQLTDGIYVDELGRVGIGTTSPGANLHILGPAPTDANHAQLAISEPNGKMLLGRAADYGFVQSHNGEPLALNPLGNNVGIGTTSPQAKLHVSGDLQVDGHIKSLTVSPLYDANANHKTTRMTLIGNSVCFLSRVHLNAYEHPHHDACWITEAGGYWQLNAANIADGYTYTDLWCEARCLSW